MPDHGDSHQFPVTIESALNTQGLADDQRALLDLVDKLQFAQLDNVKLPQIVVVGDQSAGKSSVLEALTSTPFPRSADACTRFATEIRLKRAKEVGVRVSIIPDKNRPFHEQEKLSQYGGNADKATPFEAMMRDAADLIAPRNLPGRFAARDILVVEIFGPDKPLLTLVDLPGLVRVANRDQSDADIRVIESLSDYYMRSPRTIILAVIGGNNDYVQAPILQKARQFDPKGSRTIGVLTKPDLTEKIGLEEKFIGLVSNQDIENNFRLGWFVLLNPGPPAPGQPWPSSEERRIREDEFFSGGKWSALPPGMCGVGPLRKKLSLQLQRHIGRYVPILRKQIQDSLNLCNAELKSLGPGKGTVPEMRLEMGDMFSACNNLVTPAITGNYKNPPGEKFFPKVATKKGTPPQRLRARAREESERFANRFRESGRKVPFANDTPGGVGGGDGGDGGKVGDYPRSSPIPPKTLAGRYRSKREFAKHEVEPLLQQIRGTELPMDGNPRAPYILFQDYSENWPSLAQTYKDNLVIVCNEFLAEVIDYVWPVRMREPLRHHFIEPQMKILSESADAEVNHLVDDMELEVQPFDPEYSRRLRSWRSQSTPEGVEPYTEAEEVLEKMLIYYDLTSRIFVRNVITQVVERHLIVGMLRLFNPVQMLRMSDSIVEKIASENKETRDRRNVLTSRKKAIEEAKNLCASLALRSELRQSGGDADDDYAIETDDEDSSTRSPSLSQDSIRRKKLVDPSSPGHTHISRRQLNSERRSPTWENNKATSSGPQVNHTAELPAHMYAEASVRPPPQMANSPLNSTEWNQNSYPAVPPRPPKAAESEPYYPDPVSPSTEALPRGPYQPQPQPQPTTPIKEGRKEGARQRLAGVMRIG